MMKPALNRSMSGSLFEEQAQVCRRLHPTSTGSALASSFFAKTHSIHPINRPFSFNVDATDVDVFKPQQNGLSRWLVGQHRSHCLKLTSGRERTPALQKENPTSTGSALASSFFAKTHSIHPINRPFSEWVLAKNDEASAEPVDVGFSF
jgi:hypothetical protein